MAAGLLLLAVAAVLVMVQSALAGTGGGPLTTTGAAAGSAMSPASAQVYVVRPGDTLWSIARRVEPNADIRPLVDRLDAQLGGATLYPGEPLAIPGPASSR
jgi:LysM repeat protein